MFRFKFYLLLAVLYCSSGLSLGGLTTEKPEIIPVQSLIPVSEASSSATSDVSTSATEATKPNNSSTSESTINPTTTSTPEIPTTTSKPTTPSPTTSTSKPTTPTTTSTETPTTTSKPTTTPTPPPAPGPLPPPSQGKWSYPNEKTNVSCIMVEFAAQLNVTYPKDMNNTFAYVVLNVPADAKVVGGLCNETQQWITISWRNDSLGNDSLPNNLTLVYQKNVTTKNYALLSLNISLTPELFANSSLVHSVELSHGSEWQTPLATSYRCTAPTRLNMTAESTSVVAGLTLSQLQEEAFRSEPGKTFSAARECGGGDLPDAVPIAVGCALGGLVLVVLVAYLVGRRRSAARGYLSM